MDDPDRVVDCLYSLFSILSNYIRYLKEAQRNSALVFASLYLLVPLLKALSHVCLIKPFLATLVAGKDLKRSTRIRGKLKFICYY